VERLARSSFVKAMSSMPAVEYGAPSQYPCFISMAVRLDEELG